MTKPVVFPALNFLLLLVVGVIDSVQNSTSFHKARKLKRDFHPTFYSVLDSFQNPYLHSEYPHKTQSRRASFDDDDSIALFNFPVGTKLTLTPAINVPITKMTGLAMDSKTNINLELPIQVEFKRFDWKRVLHNKVEDVYHTAGGPGIDKLPLYENQRYNHHVPVENNEIEQRILSRKLRALNSTDNIITKNKTGRKLGKSNIWQKLLFNGIGRCSTKSFADRKGILQKIELFAGSLVEYSESSKDCLLRWTCELHKNIAIVNEYGLIGEGIVLVFSTEEIAKDCERNSPELKYFKPFIKAEASGKSGNCLIFEKKCSISLFSF